MAAAPRLAILLGATGAGKSTWRRRHRRELPPDVYDVDSIAEGLGSYDDTGLRARARAIIAEQIDLRFQYNESFGLETPFTSPDDKRLVRTALTRGYETVAIFLGTADPGLNARRVRVNARDNTGPDVSGRLIAREWLAAQYNLVSAARSFDRIRLIDTTAGGTQTLADFPRGDVPALDAPQWAARLCRGLARGRLPRIFRLSR